MKETYLKVSGSSLLLLLDLSILDLVVEAVSLDCFLSNIELSCTVILNLVTRHRVLGTVAGKRSLCGVKYDPQ